MITETEASRNESSRSQLRSLVSRLGDQLLELMDTHLALLKAEVKGAAKSYSKHVVLISVSVLVAVVGFSFLSIALVLWINGYVNNMAISFGCVGGAYLTIGVLAALAALRRMTNEPPIFKQSLEEMESDRQWVRTETQAAM